MTRPTLHRCKPSCPARRRLPRRLRLFLLIGCLSPCAAALAQERVDPVPEAPEPIVEALSPFAGDPDSSRVASVLAEAAAHDFPATDYDRVLVARLWRRAGETELAMASLEAITVDSDAVDLAVYEAARTLFEANRDAAGGRAYWSVCGSADPRVRAEIAWDLLPVTIRDEREAWPDVAPGGPTCDWFRAFWEERARRMVVPVEQRIATHFRRLATARREYYLQKPRIEADMASDHGRPSGLAVDDRGLLYIRLGEPVDRQACPEEYPVPPDTLFAENRLGVCWIYERPPYYRLYYLTTKDRFGWNLPDNDYRIQENFSHQAEPGNLLFQKYVVNSDLSRSTRVGLMARGPVSRLRRLVRFDSEFQTSSGGMAEALKPLLPDAADEAEYRRYEQEMKLATRRYTAAALEQIPDAPTLRATLDLRFEVLRFLNPSQAMWQVWMLGAVPAGQLARSDGEAEAQTLDIGGRFSVTADDGMHIGPVTPRSIRERSVPPEAGILVSGATSARPGALPFTFLVEDVNAPGTGIWLQDTVNVPAIGGLPQLSDIAVAQAEGGSWTRDGQTFLQVSPAHVTNPDGSIHTYFEVYGVRPGTPYDVEFRLARLDAAERIWRLEPDDLAFRLQFTSEMPGDIGRHHLRLNLGETEPGEYVLAVRIQDEESKAYSLPSVTDVFVAER